jgi:hypothetical protein
VLQCNTLTSASRNSSETWRDGALILGRVHDDRMAGTLLLYLERDGATAALIEVGEPVIPDVSDVLKTGQRPPPGEIR